METLCRLAMSARARFPLASCRSRLSPAAPPLVGLAAREGSWRKLCPHLVMVHGRDDRERHATGELIARRGCEHGAAVNGLIAARKYLGFVE